MSLDSPAAHLIGAIRESIIYVFSQALTGEWRVEEQGANVGLAGATFCSAWNISGSLHGAVMFRLLASDVVLLAQRFICEEIDPKAELTAERIEAFQELMQQVGGMVVTSVKPRLGDVQLEVVNGDRQIESSATLTLLMADKSDISVTAEIQIEKSLCSTIDGQDYAAATTVTAAADAKDWSDLERLTNVSLPLTLHFGHATLTLRQLMNLGPGIVVELDRLVREPVALQAGNQTVATGDVVVIDGNYGIRISRVMNEARSQ